jgi:ribonucleoside-diphosphate reductase alpha chain
MFRSELAYENWKSKYRYDQEDPLGTFKRVAHALASTEKNPEEWEDKFLRTLVKFDEKDNPIGLKCTTGGRITANVGTSYKHATLMNCFITGPVSGATIKYHRQSEDDSVGYDVEYTSIKSPDDLTNIFLTILEQAKTLATEGGYGINFSFIRPRGSLIKGIGIKHPGVLAYMDVFDEVSNCIVRGTNDGYVDRIKNYLNDDKFNEIGEKIKAMARKGAMMAVLDCSHPDIEEFIRAKQESGRLTKFNMSVLISDELMIAVEKDEFFDLSFNGTVYKRVKARDLYNLIMESTYNRNEPGVLFEGNMNRNNPISYLGRLKCTNPCGEIGGLASLTTVCLLGSLNLTQYVYIAEGGKRYFDWDLYTNDIRTFTRMLDNVNDLSYISLPSYQWATDNLRQFGMGVNGLGSALMMLGIPYNSDLAIEFTKRVCQVKENLTWQTSALLAKEKGTFKGYIKEKFENTEYFNSDRITEETRNLLRKYGARNAKTTTNPPLGNSSVITGTSNGIEPLFNLDYERTVVCKEWPVGLNQDNVKYITLSQKTEVYAKYQL